MDHKKFKFIALILALISFVQAIAAQIEFGYGDTDGPLQWPAMFPTCNDRRANSRQSPINIVSRRARATPFTPLVLPRTKVTNATIENNGHTVEIIFKNDNERPKISGGPMSQQIYKFQQLHFHWGGKGQVGSENKIDNRGSDMEMHLVFYDTKYGSFAEAAGNKTDSDALVVLGVFVNTTSRDSDLFRFTDEIHHIEDTSEPEMSYFFGKNFRDFLPSDTDKYFTFPGSLTTPTCDEVVTWIVFWNPIKISDRQLDKFRQIRDKKGVPVLHNNRPVQRTNGRRIRYPKQQNFPFNVIPNTII